MTANRRLTAVQPFGDNRDRVVVLKAPGKQEAPHPATGQMSKAFDWLVHFRHYMAETGNDVVESDRLAVAACTARQRRNDGKGKQWTRDGKQLGGSNARAR